MKSELYKLKDLQFDNFRMRKLFVCLAMLAAVTVADDEWLWTFGKIVGGAAVGFVAGPVVLGAAGFT